MVISDWKHDYNHRRRHSSLATNPQRSMLPPAAIDNRILALVRSLTGNAYTDSSMLWELIKMSRRYELSILRERSAARVTVTGWLSSVMIRPVRVLGSRATPSWMNSERRS